MGPADLVTRGADVLERLLEESTFDLRRLDLPGFRPWLEAHLARWRNDPVFVQRVRIRDLRRAHPRLRLLEQERRQAAEADAASAPFARLQEVEQGLIDTGRATAGLSAALAHADPERRPRLREKRDAFADERQALRVERARLIAASPTRQQLLEIDEALHRLRAATGLDQEEAALQRLQHRQGRRSDRSGASFEDLALRVTRRCILPDLSPAGEWHVLRGVTLGAARTELDQLVIRRPVSADQPVEVRAVVEVKRNSNDLAHGFRRRQENLAWLTGTAGGYDPALYRTGRFRSGHFDRAAEHHQDGETFRFAPGSFRRFRRDPASGWALDGLYFITREGPLWGLSTAALARIGHRIATDVSWDLDADCYLRELLAWCQGLAGPVETPDVLRVYAASLERARQVLVLPGGRGPENACMKRAGSGQ